MRVLRAILGRFARFLVRIARTLDPELATAPYWVMPERMAALRTRYPGAPEHWLELVARRTSLADTPQPGPNPPINRGDGRPLFPVSESAERRQPEPGHGYHSAKQRVVRFPFAKARAAPVVLQSVTATRRQPGHRQQPAPSRSSRMVLTFAAKRVRNPIANLLRRDRQTARLAPVRFPLGDNSTPEDQVGRPWPDWQPTIRERSPIFPPRDDDSKVRPELAEPYDDHREIRDRFTDARWPVSGHRSARLDPQKQAPKASREDPRFSPFDNRWPELPQLVEESAALPSVARDDAALLAEQIGGTWSA